MPRQNNKMHGPTPVGEKAKDFKSAIKRLFKELNSFKILIIIALTLALLSSILSITAPNKLSNLTDEISKGLIINQKNLKKLVKESTKNINTINTTNINNKNQKEMPEEMQKMIFKEITIDKTKISSIDQYKFLKTLNNSKEKNAEELYEDYEKLPKSIKKILKPKMNMQKIKTITLLLVSIYLLSALFNFTQSVIMATISNKFANNLRKRISKKINKLPLKYFDKHLSGDILSRVTNDVDTIAQAMNQSLSGLISNIALFIGTLIMMFITNYIMALTAVISSFIGIIGMILILKNSQKYFTQKQEELGNLNGHIEEIYSGLNIVKTYNGIEEADKKFDEFNKKVSESNKKSQFISGLMQPMMMFIGNFGYVAVCIVGALLTMNNIITFGVIVAFITYVRLFTSPLSQIAQAMTSLQSAAAASERVFEFIDEEEMINEISIKKTLKKEDVKGQIEFKNIEFSYDGNKKPTIKNFTAKALPGQKIAIVGPTGAGKTTMVNLLMKFYEINKGNIVIDGIDINELKRENIHDLFTMVLQDTWLFEGTIKENIKFNRKNITDNEIEKVCKEVGLDHFIKTLPKGYETKIENNESVSAGQRQLLTIARGMIENAPFLILDEATSNVDTRTEELVQNAMDKLAKGKTSFIIAHRLSTIKNADLILVMKEGNIVEQGTHNELMNKETFYKTLYNSQFEE